MVANLQTRKSLLKIFYFFIGLTLFLCLYQWPGRDQEFTKRQEMYAKRLTNEPDFQPTKKTFTTAKATSTHVAKANMTIQDSKQRYYVHTENCKMPYVNPFSDEVMEYFKPQPVENCSKVERLVQSYFDANLQKYRLHINEDVARTLKNFTGDINCCYKEIVRKANNDNGINLSSCINFSQDFIVPQYIEGLIIECYSANNTKLLQMDGYAFIQMKKLTNSTKVTNIRKPSVLLIGIDALSRINFRRNMVKTFDYIKRNGWHEMQGYNKMGDNTFPNLMAVLAGLDRINATEKCRVHETGGMDTCPIIWKNFHEYGYRTAYAEDECGMSTFNYLMRGFKNPPTDYYMRPFMIAFQNHLEEKKRCGLRNCLGMRHSAQYLYDFATQLAIRYNDEPVFGLFWANSFSHNCYDQPSAMDHVMLDYFQYFEKSGVLENTIVIFFSDHGMRWGRLNSLSDGFLEERLPMLFIWLPKWFAHKHPEFVSALEINRNRLTSPYDLHMTLKHLVELASENSVRLDAPENCPKCHTLFREMAENRTCEEAGIPEHWCTCIPYEVVKKNATTKKIVQLTIDKMNQYLIARNFSTLCSELKLESERDVFHRMLLDVEHLTEDKANMFRISFKTQPNSAEFSSTVVYHKHNNTVSVDVESISRLNSYRSDSLCVNDKQAKKYCICKNAIKK